MADDSSSEQRQPGQPKPRRLLRLWDSLTEPSRSIRAPERRRQARLLSVLLLAAVPLGLLAALLTLLDINPTPRPIKDLFLTVAAAALVLVTAAYVLSRTRHYTLAAAVTVAIFLISTFVSVILAPQAPQVLAFLTLGGLTSSLFLSRRMTLLVFAVTMAGILLLATIVPALSWPDILYALFFTVVVGALVITAAAIRAQDERQIERQSHALAEREAALQEVNEKLRASISELEQHNREATLLAEMGDALLACATGQEAYAAVAHFAQQLFPTASGALFVYSSSRDGLEALASWGEPLAELQERVLAPDECWALRRGRAHVVEGPHPALLCRHVPRPPPEGYLCLPMMAQGETLGVLHLRKRASAPHRSVEPRASAPQFNQQLAVTAAEHIALALANLTLRETLRYQSIRDPLTGLFNRRYLEETLAREIGRAARDQTPLGLIMLDLDHFKHFNDSFGHDAGDAVLRELGFFLKARVRTGDIACRYGGEEFMLVLPGATLSVTRQRAEALRVGVKQLTTLHHGQVLGGVALSLGVAGMPEHGLTAEALIRAADQALYHAKQEGRDCVVVAGS